jgi:hypothetical protein
VSDLYAFDEEQKAAIARVEYLRRLREVKHAWRDYYTSHEPRNETILERRPELGAIPDARP